MDNILTKDDLLNKLRSYANNPDDDNIRYKNIIKKKLLNCPELLYAFNDKELEQELFDENGNILMDDEGNLIGEVDRYFGNHSHIRPILFFPETETDVENYLCYQIQTNDTSAFNNAQKITQVVFTIFVHGQDAIDDLTGIPRHDLIASIIREKFNWTNVFGPQTYLCSNKETLIDNNYLVRTLMFELTDTNGIVNTPHGYPSTVINYHSRR